MSEVKCVSYYTTTDEQGIAEIILKYKPQNAVFLETYTDRYECKLSAEITDTAHLLELRAFNKNCELKISRQSMGDKFYCRVIDDNDFRTRLKNKESTDNFEFKFEMRILDEEQYLDIDTTKKGENPYLYFATGGGNYELPITNAEKIKIRNYVDYDEQGIAFICDFRPVEFIEGGHSNVSD